MLHRIILLVTALASVALRAQEPAYRFTISAKGSGVPLRRAEVKTGSEVFYSDAEGKLEIPHTQVGETISVFRDGYLKLTLQKWELSTTELNSLFLYPAQPDDSVIIVTGKKRSAVSRKSITIEESKAVAPRGDPAQITKLLPGVQSPSLGPNIVVRGSAPEDSKYFVDGLDVPFIYHIIGGLSVVPEKLLEEVEFSAGGFGPEYGEATGGIVNLRTTGTIPDRPMTELKVNLPIYSSVYHERPLSEDSAFSISVRRSYLEAFLPKVLEEENTIVPVFFDSHMRYLKRTDDGYYKVLGLSSLDGLVLIVPGPGDETGQLNFDVSTFFIATGVEINQSLGSAWRYTATPQVVYTNVDSQFLDNFVKIRDQTAKFPLEWQRSMSRTDKLYFGVELLHSNAQVDVLAPRIVNDDPFTDFEEAPQVETSTKFRESIYSSWLSYDLRVSEPIVLTPSVRVSHGTQVSDTVIDPRFKALYALSKEARLKLAVGQYSKLPQSQETDEAFGNPDLGNEHFLHYVLAWEKDWSDFWTTDLQLYLKRGRDVVRSDKVLRYNNEGEQRSQGFELFLRRNPTGRSFGWLSYTYSKTEERRSASDAWQPYKYDQTHVVNLVGNYKFTGQWSLGSRLYYHTGDRYTPVSGAVYNSNFAKYQPRYRNEDRYGARLPPYYQFDIYSVYDFLWDRWKLKLRTGVEYLALERPAFGVTYNYDYTKESYFRGIPPIPYIEISGEF
ncbi:MAG: TonB-dependent receptor plug domain-containing protein [Deltaproteobacteria bacterium]|nr:TonB-dependent receptor plug domain-containing protein [Deltaproteobacteria bacterium]